MTLTPQQVAACRAQFPALSREFDGRPAAFFDGPAGTQVPRRVIDTISHYLSTMNANHGGLFPTGLESDRMLDEAHRAAADFVGASDADEIAFGANMTTLTFALSRALAKTWHPGDEILLTLLDHDANFSPWVLAAQDAGVTVKTVGITADDCTLDLDELRAKLTLHTKLVAVGCASNSVGTVNPVQQIATWANQVGALVFLDAVHFAPHALVDVAAWDCDFLACSAYKFFGPHIGIMWGRRKLLEDLDAYKVRPATNTLPGKWMTGTQSHEGIAGVLAAIEYIADLGRTVSGNKDLGRRSALQAAYKAIGEYEREQLRYLLAGLAQRPEVTVWGITDPNRLHERFATISLTHSRLTASQLAEALGRKGIFSWHGNYYALNLSEALGREPEGMVRIGLVHYNTREEIDRLLKALDEV